MKSIPAEVSLELRCLKNKSKSKIIVAHKDRNCFSAEGVNKKEAAATRRLQTANEALKTLKEGCIFIMLGGSGDRAFCAR